MTPWILAFAIAVALAVVGYAGRRPRAATLAAAALRVVGITLVAALLLDAPLGRAHPLAPWAALDVSASWGRGAGTDYWRRALEAVRGVGADTVFAFGDSSRLADLRHPPTDLASRGAGVVEQALARGRPLVVVTDGEIDDPAALRDLPKARA